MSPCGSDKVGHFVVLTLVPQPPLVPLPPPLGPPGVFVMKKGVLKSACFLLQVHALSEDVLSE